MNQNKYFELEDKVDELCPDEELKFLFLESVWYMRWNEERTVTWAILEEEEAMEIVLDIFTSLKKNGYEIKHKGANQ